MTITTTGKTYLMQFYNVCWSISLTGVVAMNAIITI